MLRFIHNSDWHLTAGKFFDETDACLRFIAEVAEREKIAHRLLPGDFTHSDLPHRVQQPLERLGVANRLRHGDRLTYGNHDIAGDLELLGWKPGVDVYREAKLIHDEGFDLLTVPYPHKRHWQAQREAGAIESGRQALGQVLGQALRALAKQRRPDVPLIGLAHLNIAGSKVGGGEVLIGQEIELSPADLDEIGCDYWALGHIHQPQQMAERAWYCGTPQPHSFGDSNVNGFNLVEIEGPGKPPRVTFIETPAVKLYTLRAYWTGEVWSLDSNEAWDSSHHVRVVAELEEADRERADWGALDRIAAESGPLSVKIERRIIPTTRVRSEKIRAAHTPAEKLHAFWETQTPAPDAADREGALELLEEIA